VDPLILKAGEQIVIVRKDYFIVFHNDVIVYIGLLLIGLTKVMNADDIVNE